MFEKQKLRHNDVGANLQRSPHPRPPKSPMSMPMKEFLKLLNSNDISKLVRVLSSLPDSHRLQENELVLKARATVALNGGSLPTINFLPPRVPMIPVVEPSNDILNEAKMACICDELLKSNNIKELERFLMFLSKNDIKKLARVLSLLPESNQLQKNESVLKARAKVAFNVRDFKEVYSILQSNNFSKRNHKALQKLWYDAHYESEKVHGQSLFNEGKLRLREKFPLPNTLLDGKKNRNHLTV